MMSSGMKTDSSARPCKRICMLSSVHSPFDVRIYHKECRTLAEAGYEVTFIFPSEKSASSNGIRMVHVPWEKSRFLRMTKGVWAVYKSARREDAAVYHFHDPELIPVGLLLKLLGKRVIYDVHEDVPRDILVKTWIPQILRKPTAFGATFAHFLSARAFDGVIAATPAIAARFPSSTAVTVQNFPRLDRREGVVAKSYINRGPVVAYVGSITDQRGAREMVKAMSHLDGYPETRLILAGAFEDLELERELRQMAGFGRVDYRGWLTREEASNVLDESRAGLVLFHPFQNYMEAQPNKLFEYMSSGIPIVVSDFPLWRRIVGDIGCGLLVDPLNPVDIARAIDWLFSHPQEAEEMGQRGAAAVRSKYNWEQESEKLLKFYSRLTNGCSTSSQGALND